MSNLSYNGQIIEQRQTDNYVNLTQMAKANDVVVYEFTRSEFATGYLKALQESINGKSPLIMVKGFGADKTTWGHPLVAIAFGQWISPEFHVWCNLNIQTLMTNGTVSLPLVVQPKLASEEKAVKVAEAVHHIQTLLSVNNPRLAQFLIDHAISDLMPSQATLTGDSLQGVVEIALEMGFNPSHDNRSQLGKYVKKSCRQLSQQEKRLVNGAMREIAVYPANHPEVREAIEGFSAL
jgi:hypothetical protein